MNSAEEDRIDLNELGIPSYADLRAITSLTAHGNGIWTDFTRYGGGGSTGILLWQFFDIAALDNSDFLL